MTEQPEQKHLMIRIFENLALKTFTEIKKAIMFAATVLATLKSERAAYQGESFAFRGFTQNIHSPFTLILHHSESTLRFSILLHTSSNYDLR